MEEALTLYIEASFLSVTSSAKARNFTAAFSKTSLFVLIFLILHTIIVLRNLSKGVINKKNKMEESKL